MDLADATLETFQPLVGDAFATGAGPGRVELVLHSALAIGDWPGGRQPFSLTFRGPREPLLPQATYRLEHPGPGTFELFVVPIGQDADGTLYEAVFT